MSNLEDVIEREQLTPIASIGGDLHDWVQMDVWYSEEERQFFWLGDSGCSCNFFGMGVYSLDSLENGSKDDALRSLHRFTENYNRFSRRIYPEHQLRAMEAIKNVQVPA